MRMNVFGSIPFLSSLKLKRMKKTILHKWLTALVFIISLMLGPVNSVLGQDITTYQYRHVDPDKAAEFIKRETTYWSKIAKAAIDKGKMSFWALLEKVGGTDLATA